MKKEESSDMLRQITYQGVFEPTGNGAFSVYFPDLPGRASYGNSLNEAQKNAQDALGLYIYGMEQDGDTIPDPSAVPEINPETTVGYLVCPVTIFPSIVRDELDNRRVKTNVTIPAWVRELAQDHGLNCSKLLEEAILDTLGIRPASHTAQETGK